MIFLPTWMFFLSEFPSPLITSHMSFRQVCLSAKALLSFPLSEKVSMCHSFLKDIFTQDRIHIDSKCLSALHLKKCAIFLWRPWFLGRSWLLFALESLVGSKKYLFSWTTFKIVFSVFRFWSLSVDNFGHNLLGVHSVSWACRFMSFCQIFCF